MQSPKLALFRSLDGSDPDPRAGRDSIDVTLSEIPLIITGIAEIPIPQTSFDELIQRFDALLLAAEKRSVDTTEERYLFKDFLTGYPRNPGGNFASMQGVVQKLSNRMARYVWIEAEFTRESNFSEVLGIPGVSGNNALALRTQLSTAGGEYSAEYIVQPRTDDEVECWVAARISSADKDQVRLLVGGQELAIEGEPVSGYGPGFAWYSFGKTRLGRAQTKAVLRVRAPEGTDIAVDALLFYPGAFRAQGTRMPDAINYPAFVKK